MDPNSPFGKIFKLSTMFIQEPKVKSCFQEYKELLNKGNRETIQTAYLD